MRKLAALTVLAVVAVFASSVPHATAGEPISLGTIRVSDGGTTNNAETGYLDGLAPTGAFRLEPQTPYSVQCDTIAYVSTDGRGTDAGRGVKLGVDGFLPTTTKKDPVRIATTVDGGAYLGGLISIAPAVGAATAICRVFSRLGNE